MNKSYTRHFVFISLVIEHLTKDPIPLTRDKAHILIFKNLCRYWLFFQQCLFMWSLEYKCPLTSLCYLSETCTTIMTL